MSQITCPGVVATDVNGVPTCEDMSGAPLAWTTQPAFAIENLEPLMLSGAFAAGFFVMAMGWVVSAGFKVILGMLK